MPRLLTRSLFLLPAAMLLALSMTAVAEDAKPPAKPSPKKRPAWTNYDLVSKAFEHTSLARCTSFAPDGKTFATGGSDRSLRIWDGVTGKVLAVHQLPRGG